MALPPIDVNEELEAPAEDAPLEDETAELEPAADAPDAMFAADIEEAFPDMEDAQILALQRAVLGLIAMGGGGAPPAPTAPMGF
jgi:hypothetical protein